jgi:hypothetical protein
MIFFDIEASCGGSRSLLDPGCRRNQPWRRLIAAFFSPPPYISTPDRP